MVQRLLHERMDNSPLIIFRVFFGVLVAMECFGALFTGWVQRNLVAPEYTFPFIPFEWLQSLSGAGMYPYFGFMGLLGISIALGFRYRWSAVLFFLFWSGAYFMQKTAYNNHYYLLVLLSLIMCFLPAHKSVSVDAKNHPELRTESMPLLVKWVVVAQLFLVYTYAAIAKLYGDWLSFEAIGVLMAPKVNYPLIGSLLQTPWVQAVVGTMGIVFDLLIIPALLWKPTRKAAFICSIFFHLFNSIVFQIGIFPYLSLAFTVFFFEPETIRELFLRKKPPFVQGGSKKDSPLVQSGKTNILLLALGLYFLLQLVLPLRHHIIQGDVLWTEEGHRLSWRMMLRSRQGKGTFKVVDKTTGAELPVFPEKYLSSAQLRKVYAYPDFTWQFAQWLKRDFAQKGRTVAVYLMNSEVSINRRPYAPFIDPNTDLANTPWQTWQHHPWILPAPWEQSTQR